MSFPRSEMTLTAGWKYEVPGKRSMAARIWAM